MIVTEDYQVLSPAEIMALHNEQTIFVIVRGDKMKAQPTNKNGHFHQTGKKPTGLKTGKK